MTAEHWLESVNLIATLTLKRDEWQESHVRLRGEFCSN